MDGTRDRRHPCEKPVTSVPRTDPFGGDGVCSPFRRNVEDDFVDERSVGRIGIPTRDLVVGRPPRRGRFGVVGSENRREDEEKVFIGFSPAVHDGVLKR